jgi:hypothetical protein
VSLSLNWYSVYKKNSDQNWQKIPQSDPFGANSPNGTPLAQAPNFKQFLPRIQASMFRNSQLKNDSNILEFVIWVNPKQ